jgi:PAS domain S-box-containing protein
MSRNRALTPGDPRGEQPAGRVEQRVFEERFRLAVEAAPAAMILCDPRGRIVFANRRATDLFGWSVDELVGSSIDLLVPDHARDAHAHQRDRYVTNEPEPRGMSGDRHFDAQRRDGTTFPAEIVLNPIPTEEGTLVLAAVSDITARKEAEREAEIARTALEEKIAEVTRANQALLRSNRDLERFAYVASHDLQEPLRMVSSYTELLGREYADRVDAKGLEMIGFAVDGARRMKALIDGLLEYSKVGRGSATRVVDGGELCRSAVALFSETIRTLGATVVVRDLPTLDANPVELELVFRNLIGNALKFTGDEPPVVEIAAARAGDFWCFRVDDNGIGVESQQSDRVFQIFQRLHSRGRYPGEGMGLALCQRIVEHHLGRIWVEPSELGGASFRFTLPVAPEGAFAAAGATHAEVSA